MDEARRRSFRIILGGDFNTVLNFGDRGAILDDVLNDFGLRTANDPTTLSWEQRWTFQSSSGIRRQIDYIFYSSNLHVNHSHSTSSLDLGSDHRAVFAEFQGLERKDRTRKQKPSRCWKPSSSYRSNVERQVLETAPSTIQDLQSILVNQAEEDLTQASPAIDKPWQSNLVRELVNQRRQSSDQNERKRLSKLIFRETRRANRLYASKKAEEVLADFSRLQKLKTIHLRPVVAEGDDTTCTPESFATLLENVYSSERTSEQPCRNFLRQIPRFTVPELTQAMKGMKLGRCADKSGILLEMVQAAPVCFHERLLNCFNDMIDGGSVDESWKEMFFCMVPKSGDQAEPTNWRPFAILSVFYKLFPRKVYERLRSTLEEKQSWDQTGF